MSKYIFQIPIGDWSGDGHGKVDMYPASASKPVEAAREAYFEAQKKYPDLDPAGFCSEYEDRSVPEEVYEEASKLGFVFKAFNEDPNADFDDKDLDFGTEEMAQYVAWFLNLGDPDLHVKIEESPPMLSFYGYDEKNRHIQFIGYGLLGN